jgi:hypothetical protein
MSPPEFAALPPEVIAAIQEREWQDRCAFMAVLTAATFFLGCAWFLGGAE